MPSESDWGVPGVLLDLFAMPQLFAGFFVFFVCVYVMRLLVRADGDSSGE